MNRIKLVYYPVFFLPKVSTTDKPGFTRFSNNGSFIVGWTLVF